MNHSAATAICTPSQAVLALRVSTYLGELDEVALVIALRTVLSMRRLTNLAAWFKTAAL